MLLPFLLRFYLPHGITVDLQSNVWITDVAMHQVFKFPPILNKGSADNTKPLLELGTRFVPGSSKFIFCKPSAVAVLPNGEFFVSDGYCNSRIIKFAADGSWLTEWGRSTLTHGWFKMQILELQCLSLSPTSLCFQVQYHRHHFLFPYLTI